jgi:hypothetical protein
VQQSKRLKSHRLQLIPIFPLNSYHKICGRLWPTITFCLSFFSFLQLVSCFFWCSPACSLAVAALLCVLQNLMLVETGPSTRCISGLPWSSYNETVSKEAHIMNCICHSHPDSVLQMFSPGLRGGVENWGHAFLKALKPYVMWIHYTEDVVSCFV